MSEPKIYQMKFGKIYLLYIKKVERKDRTKEEVDTIIDWLTGYQDEVLTYALEKTMIDFFRDAPKLNPNRDQIKGVVCGIRVEDIEEDVMREIRYLDKLIDELAKGKKMEKILRKN
ncbi:hypothetical protein SAMN05421839_13010 [Halolactibacillus halophilus]|uniref:DUF2200 domain-containing protein n=1 Tax=Halolactibacillus halophilus TaxID=306540 RepID=A0A1I5RGW6_9BACI|nr:DUF2200 domain-containing protein [Halolactibacillus halophilus]GEM02350.1 hypothetical protein HHA03_18820 [Halolactibacillus halophilus]SFP57752.1 hypothetical protein SAMN05421839_13010 [Halolactibacillus halophilus]